MAESGDHGGDRDNVNNSEDSENHELESHLSKTVLKLDEIDKNIFR